MNRRHRLLVAVPVVMGLIVGACGDDDDDAVAASLAGTSWKLATGSLHVDVPAGAEPTATFTADAVSGKSGCNNYTGRYTTTADGGLLFGDLATTRMLCPDPEMAVETAFLAELGTVASYAIDGDRLVMSNHDGDELLRFESA